MVLQLVGRRYTIEETGRWDTPIPCSEIVLIGARDGIDGEALQHSFDTCIGSGDESNSPVLMLSRRLFNTELSLIFHLIPVSSVSCRTILQPPLIGSFTGRV